MASIYVSSRPNFMMLEYPHAVSRNEISLLSFVTFFWGDFRFTARSTFKDFHLALPPSSMTGVLDSLPLF
jgi:hypothetical protein